MDILNSQTVMKKDFKLSDDLDIECQFSMDHFYLTNPERRKKSSCWMIWLSHVNSQWTVWLHQPVTSKDFKMFQTMIWLSHVNSQWTFLLRKPVTSKDSSCWIIWTSNNVSQWTILLHKPVMKKDFKLLNDLDI